MRTIICGNNIVACDILKGLIEKGEEVVGIIPENRDCKTVECGWEKPFMNFALEIGKEHNIPVYIGNVNKYSEMLKRLNPDLIAFCRGIQLVKPEILEIPNKGCTNIHYGMLPRYGGCDTIPHAILNGEKEVGVTIHYMDENFDAGKIIAQESIDISFKERLLKLPGKELIVSGLTGFETYQIANRLSVEMFFEHYINIKGNKEEKREQDLSKKLYYKKGEIDYLRDSVIDLDSVSPADIGRHVRAFYYPPKNSTPRGISRGKLYDLVLEEIGGLSP